MVCFLIPKFPQIIHYGKVCQMLVVVCSGIHENSFGKIKNPIQERPEWD
jgi:hypothetical protein